jgi:molybdopterin-containing oxidoreductase family membrane subunit
MKLERYIREIHLDNLGKLLIVLSLIWTYINILELFTGWYSGTSFENEAFKFKLFGFYAPLYWEMILFCAFVPMLIFWKKIRLYSGKR